MSTHTDLRRALNAHTAAYDKKATGQLLREAAKDAATVDDMRRASPLVKIRGVGPDIALEIVAAIGRKMVEEDDNAQP